jgi:ABC-2 type transport system permease protein
VALWALSALTVASFPPFSEGNQINEMIEDAQAFSVFHHYGSAIEGGIDWADFGGTSLAALVLVLLAVLVFQRRDIYT